METFNEMVDREFAGSEDEIEAFRVWIMYDADPAIVMTAMRAVMQTWMNSERREQLRAKFAWGLQSDLEERG